MIRFVFWLICFYQSIMIVKYTILLLILVGEKEKKLGGWDREALKEYDDDADSTLENGVGVPLV